MAYDAAALLKIQQAEATRIKANAAARAAQSSHPSTPVVNNSNYGPGAGTGRQAMSSRDVALAAMNAQPRAGVNPDGSWTNVMSGFPSTLRDGSSNPASQQYHQPAPVTPPEYTPQPTGNTGGDGPVPTSQAGDWPHQDVDGNPLPQPNLALYPDNAGYPPGIETGLGSRIPGLGGAWGAGPDVLSPFPEPTAQNPGDVSPEISWAMWYKDQYGQYPPGYEYLYQYDFQTETGVGNQ